MAEDEEIRDFKDLKARTREETAKAKEEMIAYLKEMNGIMKQLPKVTAEAVRRGIDDKIADITNEFKEIDEIQLDGMALENALNKAAEWQKSNSDRTTRVTSKVTSAKQSILEAKARMAERAVRITSGIGKALVLFGQKGLAKSMVEKVAERGEEFATKDSRIGRTMERVAESGFKVADTVRGARDAVVNTARNTRDAVVNTARNTRDAVVDTARSARDGVVNTAKGARDAVVNTARNTRDAVVDTARSARDGVVNTAKGVRDGVVNRVNETRQGLQDAADRTLDGQDAVDMSAYDKRGENLDWQNEHENRSKVVRSVVQAVDDMSIQRRENVAKRRIMFTGVVAKGLTLFGQKGKAEEMQRKAEAKATEYVSRGSRITQATRQTAEKGFEVADNARKMVTDAKEAVKKGALEFGKATYKGAATIAAVGSIALDGISKGAEIAGTRMEQAKLKVQERGVKTKIGFKSALANLAHSIEDKVTKSIGADQRNLSGIQDRQSQLSQTHDSGTRNAAEERSKIISFNKK